MIEPTFAAVLGGCAAMDLKVRAVPSWVFYPHMVWGAVDGGPYWQAAAFGLAGLALVHTGSGGLGDAKALVALALVSPRLAAPVALGALVGSWLWGRLRDPDDVPFMLPLLVSYAVALLASGA